MPEENKKAYELKGALVKCTGSKDPNARITFLAADRKFTIDGKVIGTEADTSPDNNFEFFAEGKPGFLCKYRKGNICQPKLAPTWFEETETVKYGENGEFNKLFEEFHEKYTEAVECTFDYVESCDKDYDSIGEKEDKKKWLILESEYSKELKQQQKLKEALTHYSISREKLEKLKSASYRKNQSLEEIQDSLLKLLSLGQIYKSYEPSEGLKEKRKAAEDAINEANSFIKLVESAKQDIKVNKAILLSSLLVCVSGGGVLSFDRNPEPKPETDTSTKTFTVPATDVGGRNYSEHTGTVSNEFLAYVEELCDMIGLDYYLAIAIMLHETSFIADSHKTENDATVWYWEYNSYNGVKTDYKVRKNGVAMGLCQVMPIIYDYYVKSDAFIAENGDSINPHYYNKWADIREVAEEHGADWNDPYNPYTNFAVEAALARENGAGLKSQLEVVYAIAAEWPATKEIMYYRDYIAEHYFSESRWYEDDKYSEFSANNF